MSTRKAKINNEQVLKFLKENFNKNSTHVTQLEGGEMSCPFSFKINSDEYVIRIDSSIDSYKKDEYAWKHFASPQLPIPEMIKLGKFDEKLYFAITKKGKGKVFDNFSDRELRKVIPSIISILDYIHSFDISDTNGYGYWNQNGDAVFKSWKEYILSVDKQNEDWLKNPVKEYEEMLKKIYSKIIVLSRYCPEERYLLHGDFGFTNTISDGTKITGVLDWGESRYGDFAYDIAWLDTWQNGINYEEIFYHHYKEQRREIAHIKERIFLYKLFIYYGSIIFFVQSDQKEEAEKLKLDIYPMLS